MICIFTPEGADGPVGAPDVGVIGGIGGVGRIFG